MESIRVRAVFDPDGSITPLAFTLHEVEHSVESVGRRWQAEDGLHILVMTYDRQVHHLLFAPAQALWYFLPRPMPPAHEVLGGGQLA